ncbi:WD40/YVTN/BNR-like repeat-containing protein [Diaphorobacter caeni]|uniref:WD40/YVTN/BNR-like repeat-containing protein n=1 Tax=Diaphorobacter caeni TaxID=2784387 RepID=UPI00188DF2EF|nr:YCF48-related protein [Diaphorobacter caeni]MBF5006816.1 glycosyl hydrolase [Diaphorobacter caeni]
MKTAIGIGAAALVAFASALAFAPRTPPPLAPLSVGAEKTHFNSLTMAGNRLLASGAMGEILYSDDQGAHWTPAQRNQDRQALLNNMSFAPDHKTGFAVGHENWILRTRDGGTNWEEMNFKPKNGEPLMSVARLPSGDWVSVGAFGRAIASKDEGHTWEPLALPAEVEDKHLNRIASSADAKHWLIVGERGLVLRSDDGAVTWHAEPAFYNGSFYNAMPLAYGGWLIYGMRGNVYVKADARAAWAKSSVPAPVSFFGHAQQADGSIVLVGQGSTLGISHDNGKTFTLQRAKGRATLTDVVLTDRKKGWIASDAGLQPLPDLAKTDTVASQGTKP